MLIDRPRWAHQAFDQVLQSLDEQTRGKVGRERVADVLTRLMIKSPEWASQAEIAQGRMLAAPFPVPSDAVSRAVSALAGDELGLVSQHAAQRPAKGRPYRPLQLGSADWALIGVKLGHRQGHSVNLAIVATELDGQLIDVSDMIQANGDWDGTWPRLHDIDEDSDLVESLAEAIEALCALRPLRQRTILGVGIELAGHVHEGVIVEASHTGLKNVNLARRVSRRLERLSRRLTRVSGLRSSLPVVVDNDVNVLATLQTYRRRFGDQYAVARDASVVAVFDEGIGSAPIINGQVYRGGNGKAGEIGHCLVWVEPSSAHETPASPQPRGSGRLPTFADPCHCKRSAQSEPERDAHHLDRFATPIRIMGQLGASHFDEKTFEAAAARPAYADDQLTPGGRVFETAGKTLGMAIASNVVNSVDPSQVLLFLPPPLAKPTAGSAAELYTKAMRAMIARHAFSEADQEDAVVIEPLDAESRRLLGSRAAAVSVIDSFIQHAKRTCSCNVPSKRAEGDDVNHDLDEDEDLIPKRGRQFSA